MSKRREDRFVERFKDEEAPQHYRGGPRYLPARGRWEKDGDRPVCTRCEADNCDVITVNKYCQRHAKRKQREEEPEDAVPRT
jgi:hypothetical protein